MGLLDLCVCVRERKLGSHPQGLETNRPQLKKKMHKNREPCHLISVRSVCRISFFLELTQLLSGCVVLLPLTESRAPLAQPLFTAGELSE